MTPTMGISWEESTIIGIPWEYNLGWIKTYDTMFRIDYIYTIQ
jgi:hypothetical protein